MRCRILSLASPVESRCSKVATYKSCSDNVGDSSVLEAEHLQSLGVEDELALLKLWAEDNGGEEPRNSDVSPAY